jgi:coenzyme F420-reducing hydrogenase beta subunit
MEDNGFGEYRPRSSASSCSDCDLCRKVCPFEDGLNENELAEELYSTIEGVQHTPETGYYTSTYCGGVASDAVRMSRTSGGLATWMLARLMETGVVDRVVCVASTPNPDKLFAFAEFTTVESLWTAARSSYYPVEISACLRSIAKSHLKYAVIGLPCVLKGIRRAQRSMPRLKSNIPVLLGLVCGQQRGKGFAEYLVRRAGLTMESVRRISFREKRESEPAKRPHSAVWTDESASPRCLEWNNGYNLAWGRGYFKQDACTYCDDVFAELADVVFMDAWLPGFHDDPRGTSIVIARSSLCSDLLVGGAQSGALQGAPIDIHQVIRSQQGCLQLKRESAALQVSLNANHGLEFHPRTPTASKWRVFARYRRAAENWRMAASRTALAAQHLASSGLQTFNKTMYLQAMPGFRLKGTMAGDTLILNVLDVLAVSKRAAARVLRAGAVLITAFLCRTPIQSE